MLITRLHDVNVFVGVIVFQGSQRGIQLSETTMPNGIIAESDDVVISETCLLNPGIEILGLIAVASTFAMEHDFCSRAVGGSYTFGSSLQ